MIDPQNQKTTARNCGWHNPMKRQKNIYDTEVFVGGRPEIGDLQDKDEVRKAARRAIIEVCQKAKAVI